MAEICLQIALLGTPQIQSGDSPLQLPSYRKARALLFFLAINAHDSHARCFLADVFWPELSGESGRVKLRRMVYLLNQVFCEPLLLAERDSVRLNPAVSLQLDLQVFQALSKQPANRHNLQQALALWRGELLSGYDREFEGLDEWLERQRQIWRDKALGLFRQLGVGLQANGDWQAAEQAWQRCAELSPWDAEFCRRLMSLQLQAGRRSEAVAGFEAYCRRLQLDLGLGPDTVVLQGFLDLLESNGDGSQANLRSQLHAEAVTAISASFPNSVRQRPEILAWHLQQSGDMETAAWTWIDAARRAAERWEIGLVERYCLEARQAFIAANCNGADWQAELIQLEELAANFNRASDAGKPPQANHDPNGFFQGFMAWASADAFQGQQASLPLARDLVELCRRECEAWQLHRAYWVQAHSAFFAGEFAESLVALNQIPIRPFDPPDPVQRLGGSQLAAMTLGQSAWTLHFTGEQQAALNHAQMAMALACSSDDASTLSLACFFSANLHRWRGEWPEQLSAAEQMLAIAEQPTLQAIAELLIHHARAHLQLNLASEPGTKALTTILTHTPMHEVTARSLLAEAAWALGDAGETKRQCLAALQSGERLGNRHYAATLRQLLALCG